MCERETQGIAILDLGMPEIGGTAAAIKLRERFPHPYVLFTSGHSESSSAALSQLPYSGHLQKPYSQTSLCRLLREIL